MNLPGFITRNFKLKLGCALLAVVTWAGVVYAGNPPQTRTFAVPVPQQPSSIPAGFTLINPIKDLQVRLGGTRNSLDAFQTNDLVVQVRWGVVKHGGTQSLPITITNTDPNVELLDAPTSVQANIDKLGSATVQVTVRITSSPPPGITVNGISTSPSAITVAGPQHELNGLEARVNVDLSAAKANFKAELPVYLYAANGTQLKDLEIANQITLVTVNITLSSNVTSRVVAVIPQLVGRLPGGFVLSAVRYTPLTITLSGPQDLLNAIDSVTTSPISLTGVTNTVTLSVGIEVGTQGVTPSSNVVSVTLVVNAVPTPSPNPTPSPSPSP